VPLTVLSLNLSSIKITQKSQKEIGSQFNKIFFLFGTWRFYSGFIDQTNWSNYKEPRSASLLFLAKKKREKKSVLFRAVTKEARAATYQFLPRTNFPSSFYVPSLEGREGRREEGRRELRRRSCVWIKRLGVVHGRRLFRRSTPSPYVYISVVGCSSNRDRELTCMIFFKIFSYFNWFYVYLPTEFCFLQSRTKCCILSMCYQSFPLCFYGSLVFPSKVLFPQTITPPAPDMTSAPLPYLTPSLSFFSDAHTCAATYSFYSEIILSFKFLSYFFL